MSTEEIHSSISATGRWTKSEHELFLKGLEIYGRNWKQISKFVGTRNGAQIRSHAQKYFLKNSLCEPVTEQEKTGEISCEKASFFADTAFPFEEETHNCELSHYFSEISKMVCSNKNFSFWEKFIEVEHVEIGNDQNIWKPQKSFKPYQKVEEEKKVFIIKQS